MLAPGTVVDRYVVDALIGRGGMARVYRVRHLNLGSVHALKVVEVPGEEVVERFAREARSQARLRHPNVVSVTDFVDVDGLPGLVMEYVEGRSLDKELAAAPASMETLDILFADVCSGVAAAHAVNLVHRDIKPANVLVTSVDGRPLAKVADFGIVKVIGDSSGNPTLTRSESTMGTPGYMAPEQVFDAKRVDTRADIFSLGCLLYRMWCGVPPFQGDLRTVFTDVARGRYPAPETRVPNMPERYRQAIRRCLNPDRDARPADVPALRAMLGSKVEGLGSAPVAESVDATTRPAADFNSKA